MDRRGFIGSILALGMAPAVVRASSLMLGRVWTATTYSASFGPIQAVGDFSRIWADGELIYPTLGQILTDLVGPEHCDLEAMKRLDDQVYGYLVSAPVDRQQEIAMLQRAYRFDIVAGENGLAGRRLFKQERNRVIQIGTEVD